jgi:hypothetical protein
VNKCARLARRLEYVHETLLKMQVSVQLRAVCERVGSWLPGLHHSRLLSTQRCDEHLDKCSEAKLKPLKLLLEEIKECVMEFNKVRTLDEARTAIHPCDLAHTVTGEHCQQGEARYAGN